MIVRDSPSSKSNSWKSDLEILPSPLKLNQGDPPAEKGARGEGFGSLDHLPTSDETERMDEITGGVAIGNHEYLNYTK